MSLVPPCFRPKPGDRIYYGQSDTVFALGAVKAISQQSWTMYCQTANDEFLCRIQTWALEEARRRLEAEGILEDPQNKK